MLLPFMARPLYGAFGTHYKSEQAYYSFATCKGLVSLQAHSVSSLLPDAFNALMVEALNYRDPETDESPTHFVMLHGDIAPENWWLDTMLEEIERTGVGILSAVVPIKSLELDDTSTAVGRLNKRFSKFQRMTTADTLKLPETFFPSDVCEGNDRLLLNTGLMVVDLRQDWVRPWFATGGFRFETDCWQTENGTWRHLTLPEDWLFSFDAQEKYGVKVAATTKVRVIHYGEAGFANRYPASEKVAISGWLKPEEAEALKQAAIGKDVLEVGCYEGLSTAHMAPVAKSVTVVDTFDSRETPGGEPETLATFKKNMERLSLKITIHEGTFEDVLPKLDQSFDLIFLDADHSYESTSRAISLSLPLLRPEGLLALHDHSWEYPGVQQAVKELSGKTLLQAGALVVIKPEEAVSWA